MIVSKVVILCSTLDEECGLSEYTLSLKEGLEENGAKVLLVKDIAKFKSIEKFNPDIVIIEFEYGLYTAPDLNRFFNRLRREGIKIVVTLHGINDWDAIKNDLIEHTPDAIIVHTERARRRLTERGVPADKVSVIPHGIKKFRLNDRGKTRRKLGIEKDTKVVAIHGFFEPYKNYDKVAEAVGILQRIYPDVVILQLCHSKGHNEAEVARNRFKEVVRREKIKVIRMGRKYLPSEKIIHALHVADCVVYPYLETFPYSVSGAIRMAISANVPLVCSDITFFEDIPADCALKLRTNIPNDIAIGISGIFEDKELSEQMVNNQQELVEKHSWKNISKLYIDSIQKIIGD